MNNIQLIKKTIKTIVFLALIILGVSLIVFGEGDDSPGAQGLGLLVAVGGVVGVVRTIKGKTEA